MYKVNSYLCIFLHYLPPDVNDKFNWSCLKRNESSCKYDSETLRQEEAVAGSIVRVSIVSPGAITTELTQTIADTDLKGRF
ncbi:hypothetical protein P8767_24520 [Peribacillus frigoritolerans]|nr:hypothetical protein [Peribacillus frigoritolerans]